MPSEMPYRQNFGSWGNALFIAGFDPVKWIPTQHGVTRLGTRNKTRKFVLDKFGYISVFEPNHKLSDQKGYVRYHRLLAWNAGMFTDSSWEVHHINGIKNDNRLENLQPMPKYEHTSLTHKGQKRIRHNSKPCKFCETLTASRYSLCTKHYKIEWQRGNIHESPELIK